MVTQLRPYLDPSNIKSTLDMQGRDGLAEFTRMSAVCQVGYCSSPALF